jgi:iron complex transport system permease protein
VPRVLAAFLAGAALAISGMAFQSMFRNPLATPFTLGVSSGASFGAALAVQLGFTGVWLGISGTSVAAFAGAMISTSLVYGLTFLRGGFSTATLLLAGVSVSFFFSSLILFVQYTADVYNAFRMLRWVMGGLSIVDYDAIWGMLPFVASGAVVLWLARHELNLLVLGDDLAMGRGVDVPRTKRLLFFIVSLTVGGVVAVCGPIGFVGMMVPHMCRLVVGPDHRHLAPASMLFGGAFLVLCDTVARVVLAPAELPVGVVTALLGGPFFLWLLLSGTAQRNLA